MHVFIFIALMKEVSSQTFDSKSIMRRMKYKAPEGWEEMSGIFWMKNNPFGDFLGTFGYASVEDGDLTVHPYKDWTWKSGNLRNMITEGGNGLKYRWQCKEQKEDDCILFHITPFGMSLATPMLKTINQITSFEMKRDKDDNTRWERFGTFPNGSEQRHYHVYQLIDGDGKVIESNMKEYEEWMCKNKYKTSVFRGEDNSKAEDAIKINDLKCERRRIFF